MSKNSMSILNKSIFSYGIYVEGTFAYKLAFTGNLHVSLHYTVHQRSPAEDARQVNHTAGPATGRGGGILFGVSWISRYVCAAPKGRVFKPF